VPALEPYLIEPIWEQFRVLLPERKTNHPLGCHRSRIPDKFVFEKLVEVLMFWCAYWRVANEGCSATILRRRRDEWIEEGVMAHLRKMVLEAYDRFIGLLLGDLAVDGCITKALAGARKQAGARWTGENKASSARRSWTDVASRSAS
jgi:transposase